MSRSLNGLSNVFVNTLNSGDAINIVSTSSTSQSTINVDISKQSEITSVANDSLFLLEQNDGTIKKITYQNLESNIDTNFWTYSSPSLRPDNTSDNVLIGTTSNTDSRKLIVFGDTELNDVYMPNDKKIISKGDSNDFVKFGNNVLTISYGGGILMSNNLVMGSTADIILSAGGVGISRAGSTTNKIFFNDGNFTFGNTGIFNNSVQVKSTNSATSGSITFFEASDNGTNNLQLVAPVSMSDCVLNLPSFTGTETLALSSSVPDLTTALNFATSQSSNYTIGAGGTNKNFTNFNSIRGFEIEIGDIPQDTSAPYTDTTTKGCSRIDIQCRTGSADDTINILASPVWNQGINSTINITASSRSGVLASGASNINITANDVSLPNSNGCKITLSALTEVIINSGFKINSSGTITAVGSKITNGFIDTGIGDNKIVEIDSSTVVANDYAKFTSNGLEGKSFTELASDIGSSITTVGTITTGVWNGSAISANYGGTGFQTYTIGDILYANTTTTLTKLNIGSNNTFLMSNGSIPVWNSLSFTSPLNINGTTVDLGNLSGFGSSNQIIATNGTDALEYRTLTAGTNISIGATSGTISISSSENYWERNSNISSVDIKPKNTVDNIEIPNSFKIMNADDNTKYLLFSGTNLTSTHSSVITNNIVSTNYEIGTTGQFKSSATLYLEFLSASSKFNVVYTNTEFFSDNVYFKQDSKLINGTNTTQFLQIKNGKFLLDDADFVVNDNNMFIGQKNDTENLYLNINHATGSINSSSYVVFQFNESDIADIRQVNNPGTAVNYNTGSDYRLKKDIVDFNDSLNIINNLKVKKYKFKTDDSMNFVGFIAHEVKEVNKLMETIVSGDKDEKQLWCNDCKGFNCCCKDKCNMIMKDKYQQIDYGKLTPYLTGAIQELYTIIQQQQTVINNLLSATTFANFKKM